MRGGTRKLTGNQDRKDWRREEPERGEDGREVTRRGRGQHRAEQGGETEPRDEPARPQHDLIG